MYERAMSKKQCEHNEFRVETKQKVSKNNVNSIIKFIGKQTLHAFKPDCVHSVYLQRSIYS